MKRIILLMMCLNVSFSMANDLIPFDVKGELIESYLNENGFGINQFKKTIQKDFGLDLSKDCVQKLAGVIMSYRATTGNVAGNLKLTLHSHSQQFKKNHENVYEDVSQQINYFFSQIEKFDRQCVKYRPN
jgi:Tfp pilus assembly PilM family ATPase